VLGDPFGVATTRVVEVEGGELAYIQVQTQSDFKVCDIHGYHTKLSFPHAELSGGECQSAGIVRSLTLARLSVSA
jgi:ABC-type proline/glycine betaine transport system ATPase subunit